jgi:hypothetical protein
MVILRITTKKMIRDQLNRHTKESNQEEHVQAHGYAKLSPLLGRQFQRIGKLAQNVQPLIHFLLLLHGHCIIARR